MDNRIDRIIPDSWAQQFLHDLRRESLWNEQMRERGLLLAQIPVAPLRKRIRRTVKWAIERRREYLALKIAPWLEPEDRW